MNAMGLLPLRWGLAASAGWANKPTTAIAATANTANRFITPPVTDGSSRLPLQIRSLRPRSTTSLGLAPGPSERTRRGSERPVPSALDIRSTAPPSAQSPVGSLGEPGRHPSPPPYVRVLRSTPRGLSQAKARLSPPLAWWPFARSRQMSQRRRPARRSDRRNSPRSGSHGSAAGLSTAVLDRSAWQTSGHRGRLLPGLLPTSSLSSVAAESHSCGASKHRAIYQVPPGHPSRDDPPPWIRGRSDRMSLASGIFPSRVGGWTRSAWTTPSLSCSTTAPASASQTTS